MAKLVRHRWNSRQGGCVSARCPHVAQRVGAALVKVLPQGARTAAHRPRHARVGRMDRARAGARRDRGRRGGDSAGVVPTPAVAYLAGALQFDAGVVISASHNPFQDNGIKVFSGRGEKFGESSRSDIEALVADTSWHGRSGDAPATVERDDLVGAYLDHAQARAPGRRRARRRCASAVDCANGATTTVAPRLFRSWASTPVIGGDARRPQHQPATAARRTRSCLPQLVRRRRLPARRGVRRRRRSRDFRRRRRHGRRRRRGAAACAPSR